MKDKIEKVDYVQKGFRILVSSMSGYIGQQLSKKYKGKWWNEVLRILYDQRDLPSNGDYGTLVDSLDIANCIRIIDRMWFEEFKDLISPNCRSWAKELMGIRNIVAHLGQKDLDQPMAERALDTMRLLCNEIDPDGAAEIEVLYKEVRAMASDIVGMSSGSVGIAQPETVSKRGELVEGSLLKITDTALIIKTDMTKKVTFGGKTVPYPVYKVRLDLLYYNDQNDRISTWISSYESENGEGSLSALGEDTKSRFVYNRVIEGFICESNFEAIQKTQTNIKVIGQREPGVTLADGRVVDGNRRFTCLRRLQRETPEPLYFETVIMDMDIQADKKQIKLLELAIQHGEEKKVDYDQIDFSIGTYRDIVQTKLLTVEEYAQSTNEQVADVKKRIEIAELIAEFLEHIKLPEQYHVAREFQVYALFVEMLPLLKKLNDIEKTQLKCAVFNNVMMNALTDQRKYIRDIKGLIKSDTYRDYFTEQDVKNQEIQDKYKEVEIKNKNSIDSFAEANISIAEDLHLSIEKALLRSRRTQLKNIPTENVSKSFNLLSEIDTKLFEKMSDEEKAGLKADLEELTKLVQRLKRKL